MTAPVREGRLLLAVLLLAAILRAGVFLDYRERMSVDVTSFYEFDNHTWHRFGERIASGDLLYRDAFIPCHSWAQAIAPPAQWIAWYGGPSAFYHAPLYGYFVGGVYALAGGADPDAVRVVQLALGVLRVLLVYLIARRFFAGWIPLLAALLAAVYAPLIFFELTVLRESSLTVLHLAGLLALLAATARGRLPLWLLAGLAAGFEFLGKPSIFLAGSLLVAATAAGTRRARLRFAGAVLLGFALPLGLLAARNAAVDQPLHQIDTRGPVTFIAGNAPDAIVDGAHGFHVPASTGEIVRKTGNRFPATVAEVLRRHAAAPERLVLLWARKFRAFWRDYEVPNNVNFYHARNLVGGLRLPFTDWAFVLPFAVLGLVVTWRRRRALFPLHVFMTLVVVYTVAFLVLARFRLFLVPYLFLFAAAGLAWLGRTVVERNGRRLAAAGALLVATLALTARPADWAPGPAHSRAFVRDLESHQRLLEQSDPGTAREIPFGDAERLLYGVKRDYEAGRYADCIAPLERVLGSYPDLAYTRYVLARCWFETWLTAPADSSRLNRAETELAHVLRADPSAPYAQGLRQALEGIRARQAAERAAPPTAERDSCRAPMDGGCLRFIYGEDPSAWAEGARPDDHWITLAFAFDDTTTFEFGLLTPGGFVSHADPGTTGFRMGVPPGSLIRWALRLRETGRIVPVHEHGGIEADTCAVIAARFAADPPAGREYFSAARLRFDVDGDGLADHGVEMRADPPRGFLPETCK